MSVSLADWGRTLGLDKLGQTVEQAAQSLQEAVVKAAESLTCNDTVERFAQDVVGLYNQATHRVLGTTDGLPSLFGVEAAVEFTPVRGPLFARGPADTHDIDANDIRQGALGDCYFLASLAAVARANPEHIRKMIQDHGDGTYTVTFHERRLPWEPGRGEFKPVKITVDDRFATHRGQLSFAGALDTGAEGSELWVAVLEKAYASYRGGFGVMQGGWPAHALEAITGVDSRSVPPSQVTLKQVEGWLRQGHAVAMTSLVDWKLGTLDIPDRSDRHPLYTRAQSPLLANHVYYLAAVDVEKGLLTVRNPWGAHLPDVLLTFEEFQSAFTDVASNPVQ